MSLRRTSPCIVASRFSRWAGLERARVVTSSLLPTCLFKVPSQAAVSYPCLFKSGSINIYIAPLPAFSDPDPHFSDNADRPPGAWSDSTLHGPENLLLFSWIVPRVTTSTPGGIIVRISSG